MNLPAITSQHAALSRFRSRRAVLEAGVLGVCGLSAASLLAARGGPAHAAIGSTAPTGGLGKARRCIMLFMWGGPSQLETWDPKPAAPDNVRGPFQPIDTNVPGVAIGQHFPRLAQQADKYAIVRSVHHNDGAHLSSVHHLMTGRLAPQPMSDAEPPSREDWPHIGSWLARLRGSTSSLPPSVMLPWSVLHPAAPGGVAPGQHGGMLGPAYDPFIVAGDPNAEGFQPPGLALPDGLSTEQLAARHELLRLIDAQARRIDQHGAAGHYGRHKQRAADLVTSPAARRAFDLTQESDATRERYGRNIHGQCVLMARRLIEADVPLVCVNWHNDGKNFWDTHGNNFDRHANELMPASDQAFSALLEDLAQRGLLDETIVLWVGEFGRAPQIDAAVAGRNHWPWCYSAVLAGGGIRGGQVYGSSDALAAHPASQPVAPADLTATLYHALGVEADTHVADRLGRPVRITQGNPILPLFG